MNHELTRKEALELLYERPIEIGHWVGFKDLTDLHNDWLWHFLYDDEDQTLQGHRGSYKTTTLSLFFAENMIIYPNKTILFFRKTGSDVTEIIRQTSNILKTDCMRSIVHALYGKNTNLLLVKDSNTEISTNLVTGIKGQSQLLGLGIGTSITGKHADIVVTDDIVNVKDRISSAERENTKIAYQELINVKNRGGRFINTGTPWHKEDAFTLMPNPRKFDCYNTGLMSDEQIENVKRQMAPSLFAANYELRHIASEDVIFTEPQQGGDPALIKNGIAHLDSAFYGEDYTAFTVGKIVGDKLYLYGRIWRKHVEDLYPTICDLFNQFLCGKLYNEKNADKGLVARDLKSMGIRTVTYDERMNKYIKIVTYLKHVWKDVIFVEGTDPEYIQMICDYTENAEHDDAPDSAASLVRIFYPKIGKEQYKPLYN